MLFYVAVKCAWAQSEPQFAQYMYNKYLFDPAYAGSAEGVDMSLLYRNQYVGLTTRPIATEGFNVNMPVIATFFKLYSFDETAKIDHFKIKASFGFKIIIVSVFVQASDQTFFDC